MRSSNLPVSKLSREFYSAVGLPLPVLSPSVASAKSNLKILAWKIQLLLPLTS
jgi:hypothetical protein